MTTRKFHLGDILSITTGRLLSPRHMDGIYDILDFMTGDSLMTHQLIRASKECAEPLLAQHPDLTGIHVPENLSSEKQVYEWLATQTAVYGETREVTPLTNAVHRDPITELAEMVGPDRIVAVVLPE